MNEDSVSSRLEALEARLDTVIAAQAREIAGLKNVTVQKREAYYQRLVENLLQGNHLHIPGVGQTDVTTSEQHAEVKRWSRYHEVLGQLTKYQQASPRAKLAVYFFGPRPNANRVQSIEHTMAAHNIHMFSFADNDQLVVHQLGASVETKTSTFFDLSVDTYLHQRTQLGRNEPYHIKHIKDRYNEWAANESPIRPQVTTFTLKKMLHKAGYDVCDKPRKSPICCTTRSQGPTVLNFEWVN